MHFFAKFCQPGVVLGDPFMMKTGPDLPGRQPDLFYLESAHRHRLKPNYLDGPADLVVEVVSPESRTRDRDKKRREYAKGRVREYWYIDHERRDARFYQLDANGKYQQIAPDAQGVYHSAVLQGVWLRVDWLWQEPLPDALGILKQWGLI